MIRSYFLLLSLVVVGSSISGMREPAWADANRKTAQDLINYKKQSQEASRKAKWQHMTPELCIDNEAKRYDKKVKSHFFYGIAQTALSGIAGYFWWTGKGKVVIGEASLNGRTEVVTVDPAFWTMLGSAWYAWDNFKYLMKHPFRTERNSDYLIHKSFKERNIPAQSTSAQ